MRLIAMRRLDWSSAKASAFESMAAAKLHFASASCASRLMMISRTTSIAVRRVASLKSVKGGEWASESVNGSECAPESVCKFSSKVPSCLNISGRHVHPIPVVAASPHTERTG